MLVKPGREIDEKSQRKTYRNLKRMLYEIYF
jgi:hypothetical protein